MSVHPTFPDTPPTSATSSALTPPTTRKLAPKTSRHRFKPQLSCMFCRNRKLKCDRKLPCDNCQKRGVSSSCMYASAGICDKTAQVRKPTNGSSDVQARIQHLEEMVTALASSQHQSRHACSPSSPHAPAGTENSFGGQNGEPDGHGSADEPFGRMSMEDNQPQYVGGAHWAAVLASIAELKDSLELNEKQQEATKTAAQAPDLLVGVNHHASRSEILAAIPSKPIADELVAQYFKGMDMASTILHVPTFWKEYEDFWRDPLNAPIMWIGLLFSIFTLSAHFQDISGESLPPGLSNHALRAPLDLFDIFRVKTVQCLILGNYTEPVPYTVPTLLLYMVAELCRASEFSFPIWIIFGIIVRSAMRMGYHRDASHYPNVSVFQGEMQRRLWAGIEHLDLQTSSHVGLPRMIKKGMSDTALPRHLFDEDFSPESTVLPPPRPDSEITPLGYSIVKHRLTAILGEISDQANSIHSISYDEVMRLDATLHEVHARTPEYLKVHSIDDLSSSSDSNIIPRKLSLELNFLKSRCVLHRKFLVPTPNAARVSYPYSVQSCVDASMRILQCHMYVCRESKAEGSLYDERWKIHSFMPHDYLLAGMLICLYLGHILTEKMTIAEEIRWTREEMLFALDESSKGWGDINRASKEATKASKALKAMVVKIRNADLKNKVKPSNADPGDGPPLAQAGKTTSEHFSSANDNDGPASWYQTPSDICSAIASETMDSIMMMGGPSLNLDWELWDSQLQGTAIGTTSPEFWTIDSSTTPLSQSFSNSPMNNAIVDWGIIPTAHNSDDL